MRINLILQRVSFLVAAALAALLATAVLWPGLGGAFIFDDLPNITDNARLHLNALTWPAMKQAAFSYEPGGGSRPLAMISFALDHWRAGGLDPMAFKQTNLLIHALTVLALAFMLRELLGAANVRPRRRDAVALLVSLAWAIHPLQASSVLYVVQRMQTLGTLFMVLGLLAFVLARSRQQEGRSGVLHWALMALWGVLGFACKEDVLLLPALAYILELTIFRFEMAEGRASLAWRRIWGVFGVVGAILYFFVVVPRYWHWDAYGGRDFSTVERLMTQGRVLVMYLGQILLPEPSRLPFYYDGLVPSRGLLEPLTTLPSLMLIALLLGLAWRGRRERPLFATGVLWFFVGHFITSNVLNLELAFEHRNHFPLIGALLAFADLALWLRDRLKPDRAVVVLLGVALLVGLGTLTFIRASIWGAPLHFALYGPNWAPDSVRAWQLACKTYFERSGGDPGHPFFSFAIRSCQKGADLPQGLMPLADVIILKSVQAEYVKEHGLDEKASPEGDNPPLRDVREDWALLQQRLRTGLITPEGRTVMSSMLSNGATGVPLDQRQMVLAIEAFDRRGPQTPVELANTAEYLLLHAHAPDKALEFYSKAIQAAAPGDPLPGQIYKTLQERGLSAWVEQLQQPPGR